MNNLNRFITAQQDTYSIAFSEIKSGMKRTHWMWYVFPQIVGLGESDLSTYYGICDLCEAREYLDNDVLGNRLREISNELLKLQTNDPVLVFGMVDSLKLNSCMTLFDFVSDKDDVFKKVIDKFYCGKKDELTLQICNNMMKKNYEKVKDVKLD